MISKKMLELGKQRSVIRDMFEYGREVAARIGEENVLDFSLGNPSVPAPRQVEDAIARILREEDPIGYHGYTSAPGDPQVRQAVAEDLNARFATAYTGHNIFMTCGSAASLNITFRALLEHNREEIVANIPYFPEYRVFVESQGGKFVLCPCKEDMEPDLDALARRIGPFTKGVIINSPNNPSGMIYSRECLESLCRLLEKKEKEFGKRIFLISDEPYRELYFTKERPPFLPLLYKDTIVCYSWSKSLSLPGERIGYVLVPNTLPQWEEVMAAVAGAARSLGYVCAPSLFQRVIKECLGAAPNLEPYRTNRDLLERELAAMGYETARAQGAFYMLIKTPERNGEVFCERAKKKNLLLVPGRSFGVPEYVRLAYCTPEDKIKKSLPIFQELMGGRQVSLRLRYGKF